MEHLLFLFFSIVVVFGLLSLVTERVRTNARYYKERGNKKAVLAWLLLWLTTAFLGVLLAVYLLARILASSLQLFGLGWTLVLMGVAFPVAVLLIIIEELWKKRNQKRK